MQTDNKYVYELIMAVEAQAMARLKEARKRGLGSGAEEAIHQDLDYNKQVIRTMTISYETARPATPETVRTPNNDHKLVRMRVTLPSMTAPQQYEVNPESELTIADKLGTSVADIEQKRVRGLATSFSFDQEINAEVCFNRQLIEEYQDKCLKTANYEVLLYVTAGKQQDSKKPKVQAEGQAAEDGMIMLDYVFYVIDMRPLNTAIQVVGPAPGELQMAENLFSRDPNIVQTALDLISDALEIQNLESLPILREAIEFQVIAGGTEGDRGHAILIGPPSVGKSLVSKTAEKLEPVFHEALPTKITEAGLIGSGTSVRSHRIPGLVPKAHTGTFAIQDFNQANRVKNQRVIATLTTVMQDQKAIDASVSMTTYRAEVAVLLDANRRSDVRRTASKKVGLDRFVEDTGIPTNILSRTHYIVEFPRDMEKQIQTALAMIANKRTMTEEQKRTIEYRLRILRVYLAMVRENFRIVTIDDDVRAHMRTKIIEAINVTTARWEQFPEMSDFITRLAEQVLTLTEAHARLHFRGHAINADVDAVMQFLWRKLDFLRSIMFGGQLTSADTTAAARGRRNMIRLIVEKRGLRNFTVEDIRRVTGITSATLGTIREDLEALYSHGNDQGRYLVDCVQAVVA